MKNNFQVNNRRQINIFLILIPGTSILFIQYVWKMFYIDATIPGIYWLFVFLDRAYILFIIITAVAGTFLLILWVLSRNSPKKHPLLTFSLSIFLVSIDTICTFPINFAKNTLHMQSLRAGSRVYYLGAYPMFDINFYIAECDQYGILCRTIFNSYDVIDQYWENSHLSYDPSKHELKLAEPEEGVIFTYAVP